MAKQENKTPSEEIKKDDNLKVESDTVEVKKEDLQRLFDRIEKQEKDIEILYKVADKGRLENQTKNGEPLIKTCKISTFDGNIIIAWKLKKNICEIVNGRWVEDQVTELIFEDGKVLELPILDFYRKIVKIDGVEILSKSVSYNDKGEEESLLKLQLPDGKVLEIKSNYIN